MSQGMRWAQIACWAGPSSSLQARSCTKQSDWDDFLHNESKPLALPWGQTPRLNFGVRVRNHVVRTMCEYLEDGRSGTLVGQGPADIMTADADYLPRMLGFNFFSSTSGTIDSVKSILTQSALDVLCEKFYILDVVHLELPVHNDRIHNSPTDILKYFQINLSQLSVIAAAKVSHFEILCRVHGFVPTVEMDLFAFINHADPTKVRIGEREVAEGEGASDDDVNEEDGDAAEVNQTEQGEHVVDVGGIDVVADDEVQVIVADKPQRVRKKRKATDGASGSGLPPKKLREDYGISGIGASTCGKSVAALQSLLEGSTLAVEVGVTAAAIVPFVTSSVTPTPEREGPADSISGTGLRTQHLAERFVISSDSSHELNENDADDEVTSIVRSSMPPPLVLTAVVSTTIIASATSTPIHKLGVRQVQPSIFRDFASPNMAEVDVAGPSQPVGTELSARSFYVSMFSLTHNSEAIPGKISIPKFFSQLRGMNYEQLLAEFNVGAAHQECWDRPLAEATQAILLCSQVAIVEAAETAQASELNGLKEQNAVLEGQIATLESVALSCDELSVKASSLEFEKDKLVDQVSALETTCSDLRTEVMGYKLFKEQIEAVQDVQVNVLTDRVVDLDAELIRIALHLDEEFYPRYLTTIASLRWILSCGLRLVVMKCLQSPEYLAALGGITGRAIDKGIQDGLAAGIDHGKAGRVLAEVATYDPVAKANYVAAMNALRAVDFPFLA
ncbi:hypothetical protein Tco_0722726 [Tanacetum coccineum]